ncbi:MAG TPA: glycosyltransferase family 39 protein [Burkholderiaceae bacterium]|nr:glycosyltransferase family 39 protein [Burkholderiaceae bacterium]
MAPDTPPADGGNGSTLRRDATALVVIWWAALLIAVLAWRPLTPVDETRYASVAWEMWLSGDPISLRLNGALYGDKPPLLFWLINLGWLLFGPVAWWPRVLTALFALGTLAMARRLARQLAPGHPDVVAMTVMVMGSSLFWIAFTGAVMFDTVLSFFVVLGISAVFRAADDGRWRHWLAVGAAIGLGILTKGPVALLHILPLALLAPWWRQRAAAQVRSHRGWAHWYGGVGLALLVASAIALAWAVPAAQAGGDAFGRDIFWSQTFDRVATTSHHLRPAWFYGPAVLLLMLPWPLCAAVWRGVVTVARRPGAAPSLRPVLAWLLPVVVAFSLFRGKQVQYLLPEAVGLGFVVACALSASSAVRRWESWLVAAALAAGAAAVVAVAVEVAGSAAIGVGVALAVGIALAAGWHGSGKPVRAVAVTGSATVAIVVALLGGPLRAASAGYDMRPVGRHLAALQTAGHPVAHFGKYHGQYQFVGRLRDSLVVIRDAARLREWAAAHPQGRVVVYSREPPPTGAGAEFVHRFRRQYVSVWRGADLVRADDRGFRHAGTEP